MRASRRQFLRLAILGGAALVAAPKLALQDVTVPLRVDGALTLEVLQQAFDKIARHAGSYGMSPILVCNIQVRHAYEQLIGA